MKKTLIALTTQLAVENLITEGVDDLFPKRFEIDRYLTAADTKRNLVKIVTDRVHDWIMHTNVRHAGPIDYLYLPKNRPGLRKCAFIDIMDYLVYMTLVLLAAPQIEASRVPLTKNTVFSYRYLPKGGYLFSKDHDYTTFRSETRTRLEKPEVKYLVHADIADFYDRVNIHRLESQLHSATVDERIIVALNDFLLHWANRDSYGLPVGSHASRILAEAVLTCVDEYLIAEGISFIRFVDDFRLFPASLAEAHAWLEKLQKRLVLDGLHLNAQKERILPKIDALEDFKKIFAPHPPDEVETHILAERRKRISEYTGLFPLKFRIPSASKSNTLKLVPLESVFESLPDSAIADAERFIHAVKATWCQQAWTRAEKIVVIALELPKFLPFVTDFLAKSHALIPANITREIADVFSNHLSALGASLPEYAVYYICRYLGQKQVGRSEPIVSWYLKHHGSISTVLACSLLSSLQPVIDRGQFIRIRPRWVRMSNAELRQLIELSTFALPAREYRAWLKVLQLGGRFDPVMSIQLARLLA